MKFDVVKNAVTSKTVRQVMVLKKHSPALMFGAGVVGVVGTTVLACRATLKVEAVLDTAEKKKIDLDQVSQSSKEHKKDLRYIQIQTMGDVARLYAPPVALGVVSVGLLTGSHVTLTKRNVGLTAAYKTLEEGFEKYRERIREEQGEDKERELYRDVKQADVHNTAKGSVDKKKYINPGGGPPSPYAKFFDENNQNWVENPEYNLLFLRAQQTYANDRLLAKGHLLLNDIYDALGMERTTAGCVVGWVKGNGDDYIDFGIFDPQKNDRFYDFIHGDEGIWLDFNVDGIVYDKI